MNFRPREGRIEDVDKLEIKKKVPVFIARKKGPGEFDHWAVVVTNYLFHVVGNVFQNMEIREKQILTREDIFDEETRRGYDFFLFVGNTSHDLSSIEQIGKDIVRNAFYGVLRWIYGEKTIMMPGYRDCRWFACCLVDEIVWEKGPFGMFMNDIYINLKRAAVSDAFEDDDERSFPWIENQNTLMLTYNEIKDDYTSFSGGRVIRRDLFTKEEKENFEKEKKEFDMIKFSEKRGFEDFHPIQCPLGKNVICPVMLYCTFGSEVNDSLVLFHPKSQPKDTLSIDFGDEEVEEEDILKVKRSDCSRRHPIFDHELKGVIRKKYYFQKFPFCILLNCPSSEIPKKCKIRITHKNIIKNNDIFLESKKSFKYTNNNKKKKKTKKKIDEETEGEEEEEEDNDDDNDDDGKENKTNWRFLRQPDECKVLSLKLLHQLFHGVEKEVKKKKKKIILSCSQSFRSRRNIFGANILHYAAANNDLELVKELIMKEKYDFDSIDNFGNTPLHYADFNRCKEVYDYLISKKVIISPNFFGRLPFRNFKQKNIITIRNHQQQQQQEEEIEEIEGTTTNISSIKFLCQHCHTKKFSFEEEYLISHNCVAQSRKNILENVHLKGFKLYHINDDDDDDDDDIDSEEEEDLGHRIPYQDLNKPCCSVCQKKFEKKVLVRNRTMTVN